MKKIKEIKTIAFDAMFLALIFVFAYVPYLGYITIGPLAFTLISCNFCNPPFTKFLFASLLSFKQITY